MSRIHRIFHNFTLWSFTISLLSLGAIGAFAQGAKITYAYSQVMSGFQTVVNVAVDSAGNLYVIDNDRSLYKETLNSDGSYTQSTISIGSGQPVNVAADAAGNLYVATGSGSVLKETYSGGSYTESTAVSGFTYAFGIAIDGSGNLYVVDYGAGKVYKETVSGSSYMQSIIATGLNSPDGSIALDGSGNVYVSDTGNSRVLKETLSGGVYTQSVVVDATTINHQPNGVAVNAQGTVFISYNSSGNGVYAAVPNGSAYTASQISVAGGIGITTDNKGTIYLASGYEELDKLTPNQLAADSGSVNFGPHEIGSDSGTQTVTFTFAVPSTLESSPFAVSMQGNLQADFQAAATQPDNVCAGGHAYAIGDTCSVAVHFLPTRPGVRYGAVALFQTSSAPVGTAYLQGEGVGPQVSFSPRTPLLHNTGDNATGGYVAFDGLDGVLASDGPGIVDLIPANGQMQIRYPVITGFPTGNSNSLLLNTLEIEGIGIDGAGNALQIANGGVNDAVTAVDSLVLNPYIPLYQPGTTQFQPRYGDLLITSFNPTQNGNTTPTLVSTNVAADGSGNLYFSDQTGNRVLKESWSAGGYNQQTVVDANFNNPSDVVVDGSGNLFVLDAGSNRIIKETPSDTGYTASTVVDNLASPQSLAIDRLGNLYITLAVQSPPFAPAVLKEALVNGVYQPSSLNLLASQGIAVDAAGNVFAANPQGMNMAELDVADPPQLTFASTAVGTKSADSPQTVTLVNNGNEDLTFSVPASGNNPAITSGFTLDTSSTCPILSASSGTGTLPAGSSCTLVVNFIPIQSGVNQGTLTISDNHLNAAGSRQVIQLNGSATGTATVSATLSPATCNYGNVTTGMSASQGFTLANTGTVAITINSVSLPNAIFTVANTTCGTTLAAGATCTYAIAFMPTAVGVQTATFSVSYNSSTLTSSLTGTGVAATTAAPQASLAPTVANFGSVMTGNASSPQVFTLSNAGNAALPVTSIRITGTNASDFVLGSNTCGTSLGAGSSCTIGIAFKPSITGSESASLTVVDSVGAQSASLSGTGSAVQAAPDFTIAATPASQSGPWGGTVSYTVQLVSSDLTNPFTQPVGLTASGLPRGATVQFSPNSVVPGTTQAASSTMTITISALSAQSSGGSGKPMLAGISLGSLALLFVAVGARRRRMWRLLLLATFAIACITTALTGCGSQTGFAVPGSTSTITVTGTSGNTSHTTTVTLTVR